MKITPGGKALPDRVPVQDPGTPEDRFRWRRRSGLLLEKTSIYLRFLRPRGKHRRKGGPRQCLHHPGRQGARAPPGRAL